MATHLQNVITQPPNGGCCSECEEEIWEEVPCEQIATSQIEGTTIEPPTTAAAVAAAASSTTTTSATTTTTTAAPTTIPATVTSAVIQGVPLITTTTTTTPTPPTPPTTAASAILSSPANSTGPRESSRFRQCYCECKVGCKQFCRKVVVNDDLRKQVTHISSVSQEIPSGSVEFTHVNQRKFIPNGIVPLSSSSALYRPEPPVTATAPKQSLPAIIIGRYPVENSLVSYVVPPPPAPPSSSQQQPHQHASVYASLPTSHYTTPIKTTAYYPEALVDSSYSIDDLTKLLQAESAAAAANLAGSRYTPSIVLPPQPRQPVVPLPPPPPPPKPPVYVTQPKLSTTAISSGNSISAASATKSLSSSSSTSNKLSSPLAYSNNYTNNYVVPSQVSYPSPPSSVQPRMYTPPKYPAPKYTQSKYSYTSPPPPPPPPRYKEEIPLMQQSASDIRSSSVISSSSSSSSDSRSNQKSNDNELYVFAYDDYLKHYVPSNSHPGHQDSVEHYNKDYQPSYSISY